MKFSIITPSFNQAKYISETIESVISQKGDFEIEYLVFDGESGDGTRAILQETEDKISGNQRIRFYWQSKKDKGQVDAINQGLKMATGDVVAYLNSDDYYLPGAFAKVKAFFLKNPDKQWLVGNAQVSDEKLKWTFWLKHIWPVQHFGWALSVFNTINQPAVFLRMPLVRKIGLFDIHYKYAFDYEYWLRCDQADLPARIFTPLAMFRVHNDSKGNTGYKEQFEEDMEIMGKYNLNPMVKLIHKIGQLMVNFGYKLLK